MVTILQEIGLMVVEEDRNSGIEIDPESMVVEFEELIHEMYNFNTAAHTDYIQKITEAFS
jgi:hypothetical protein